MPSRVQGIIVILTIIGHLPLVAKGVEQLPVSISTNVSWATSGAPEVHVLLKNNLSKSIEFSLTPRPLEGPTTCKSNEAQALYENYLRTAKSRRESSDSNGSIPAKGWTHRVIQVATGTYSVGCNQPLYIHLFAPVNSGRTTLVHLGMEEILRSTFEGPSQQARIIADTMVETDETQGVRNAFLLRTLVQNNESTPITVAISDRRIVCRGSSPGGRPPVMFSPAAIPQGIDSGPQRIGAGSWAVFVSSVLLKEDIDASSCAQDIEISIETRSGFTVAKLLKVKLMPNGFLSDSVMH